MKARVKVEKEVEIVAVRIEIAPRYIGDSGDDDMPTSFPLLNDLKSLWQATVNIDTGQIESWPIGDARKMHVKVCDAGRYSLIDQSGVIISVLDGYVPNKLIPGEYGDYVILDIDANGIITNWPKKPSLEQFFDCDD